MVRDKHSIAVKWNAQDENDDSLVYSVYYRGDGDSRWKLLRDGIEERFVNLDSDLFPDGGYTIRVVASDAPSHSSEDTLTGESTSPRFEVDNTPPHIEALSTRVEGNQVHVSLRAVDSFSPISRAEYSLDASDWQTVEPVGHISDYKVENYDFNVPIPAVSASESDSRVDAATGKRVAGGGSDRPQRAASYPALPALCLPALLPALLLRPALLLSALSVCCAGAVLPRLRVWAPSW